MENLIVAICYDFDKTLSPKDMQEYGFIDKLGISPDDFWNEVGKVCLKYKADNATGYMFSMVEKYRQKNMTFTRQDLNNLGRNIELYQGVKDWFSRINEFGKVNGVTIEHYIISSGNKEILEATPIAKEFKEIYASSFIFDDDEKPVWPSQAVNYTNKTQYLFRINKGILDVNDNTINDSMKHENRRIPFKNIIYVGDSLTDVPCMRLTIKSGGNAIGVYDKNNSNLKPIMELLNNNRIDYFVPCDYTENSEIDKVVKEIILECKHKHNLELMSKSQKEELLSLQKNRNK